MTCKLIEVIETIITRGSGTPDNPYRSVVQYWSKGGQLLAESDPQVLMSALFSKGGTNADAS